MMPTIIQTTCSTKKEAKKIAKVLIEQKLAACVQFAKIKSMYKWNNELCFSKEILLNIKTTKDNFNTIKNLISKLHSYDVPEIIQIDISELSENYLKFIKENTK